MQLYTTKASSPEAAAVVYTPTPTRSLAHHSGQTHSVVAAMKASLSAAATATCDLPVRSHRRGIPHSRPHERVRGRDDPWFDSPNVPFKCGMVGRCGQERTWRARVPSVDRPIRENPSPQTPMARQRQCQGHDRRPTVYCLRKKQTTHPPPVRTMGPLA